MLPSQDDSYLFYGDLGGTSLSGLLLNLLPWQATSMVYFLADYYQVDLTDLTYEESVRKVYKYLLSYILSDNLSNILKNENSTFSGMLGVYLKDKNRSD